MAGLLIKCISSIMIVLTTQASINAMRHGLVLRMGFTGAFGLRRITHTGLEYKE